MRLLIVGAGSTGGYIGGRLAEAGRDVTFLVRPARAEQLRRSGLEIISPKGNATVTPKLVTTDTIDASFDAILLSVKGFHLEQALKDLRPAVGSDTMILPVLNGMNHMDVIAKRFSSHNLVGCALKIATILDDNGRIVHLNPLQDLAYGELDSRVTPRMEQFHAFMQAGGLEPRLSPHIHQEMWEKWTLLASVGATTCLMRGSIGDVEAAPDGAAAALAILDEVTSVVKVVGIPPSDSFLTATRQQLTTASSPLTSSMYRDLIKGRPVEVENIIGDLVRLARKASVSTPLLAAIYVALSVYQNKLAKA